VNEDTFLAALLDDVTDEVTWAALADWLEEDDQPRRAELTRLVRQLLALSPLRSTPERKAAEKRIAELLLAGVRSVVPEVVNSIGMRLALIPPGTFRMGSPQGERGRNLDEKAHEVTLRRAYYLGVFPVTQRQFEEVVGYNPSHFGPSGPGAGSVADLDVGDFPVERVSFVDAVTFCERLSESLSEIRAGRTYRLPTEAEWERACRAGTNTAFCFGASLHSTHANINGGSAEGGTRGPFVGRPTKVGSYPPNAFGLYDVHGNVYEWCSDWYDERYEVGPVSDPQGPESGLDHPLRGGSWAARAVCCRSAWRDYNEDEAWLYINGFRVVMQRRERVSRKSL
jgi:uncharacterized protein (TIGR02996 family)